MAISQCKLYLRIAKYVQDLLGCSTILCLSSVLMPPFWIPFFSQDGPLDATNKKSKSGRAEWHETGTELFRSAIYKHGGVRNAKTKCVFTTSCDSYLGSSIYKHRLDSNCSVIWVPPQLALRVRCGGSSWDRTMFESRPGYSDKTFFESRSGYWGLSWVLSYLRT